MISEEGCKEDGNSEKFEEISNQLNTDNREQYLFNCLKVPSDDVRLSVVMCLNNVPLSELEIDEISYLIKVLGSCKNIGAGKTELVLSAILWILTKLMKDQRGDSAKNFRVKYGRQAVDETLEILSRN